MSGSRNSEAPSQLDDERPLSFMVRISEGDVSKHGF